jgi:hypothetical protein
VNDETPARLLALVPAPESCVVCADRGVMLLTRLSDIPVLGVVECPLCSADQPARVIPAAVAS